MSKRTSPSSNGDQSKKEKPKITVRPTDGELKLLHARAASFGYKSLSKYLIERGLRDGVMIQTPERERLERLAAELHLTERVRFLGRVPDDDLVRLYRTCRAVVYVPIDEDYGYAAVEGLMAGKPVLTATDSGGTREFVRDGGHSGQGNNGERAANGAVVPPEPNALARVLDAWWHAPAHAAHLGTHGPQATAAINWDTVVHELTR